MGGGRRPNGLSWIIRNERIGIEGGTGGTDDCCETGSVTGSKPGNNFRFEIGGEKSLD